MKASAASLWLLMVAFGNLLDVFIAPVYKDIGPRNFFFLNSGIIFLATLLYFWIRTFYVYRENRVTILVNDQQVGEMKQKS